MLSVFPELFNYSQLSPLILRISLAVILLNFGYAYFKQRGAYKKTTGTAQIATGLLLLTGTLTQVAALASVLLVSATAIKIKIEGGQVDGKALRIMILAASLALLFLGPGLFSIDLPL